MSLSKIPNLLSGHILKRWERAPFLPCDAVNNTTTFKNNCERLCHKLNIRQCYIVSLMMPISWMTKLRLGKPRPPTAPSEMVPDCALGLVLLALPPDSVLPVWPIGHVGMDSCLGFTLPWASKPPGSIPGPTPRAPSSVGLPWGFAGQEVPGRV